MNSRRRVDRPLPLRRLTALALVTVLSEMALGCARAANQPASTPDEQRVLIARPCASARAQSSRGVPVGLVLEVANVAEPIGAPIKGWLAAHPVRIHGVARLVLQLPANTPAQGPFGICSEPACATSEDATLEVSVTGAPTDAAGPVELQLTITSANGSSRRLSVKTTDQEPAGVSVTTAPKQALVVTPYYLFEPREQSLEQLMQCAARDAGPIRVGEAPTSIAPTQREH
ncbi:MAG TPA: hypothetical protein VER11_30285 [Polyangiaceae bacterium]|nr:hypothetical protein [Polyangiaceae bacterium]